MVPVHVIATDVLSGEEVVLSTGDAASAVLASALDRPPTSPVGAAAHALTLLLQQRLIIDVAHLADDIEVIVAPPLCPLDVAPVDFVGPVN